MNKGLKNWLERNSAAIASFSAIVAILMLAFGPLQGWLESYRTDVRLTFDVIDPNMPPDVVSLSRAVTDLLRSAENLPSEVPKTFTFTEQEVFSELRKLRNSTSGRKLLTYSDLQDISRVDVKIENLQNKNLTNSRLKIEGIRSIWDLEVIGNSFTQREINDIRAKSLKPLPGVDFVKPNQGKVDQIARLRELASDLRRNSQADPDNSDVFLIDLPSLPPNQKLIFKIYGDASFVQASLVVNEAVKIDVNQDSINPQPSPSDFLWWTIRFLILAIGGAAAVAWIGTGIWYRVADRAKSKNDTEEAKSDLDEDSH